MTDPFDPITFPKRVVINLVFGLSKLLKFALTFSEADNILLLFSDWIYISARRLEAPIILVGFTALSVEIIINFSTS
ncbi:hypothetical protein D3C80_1032410 [compost metagenome]